MHTDMRQPHFPIRGKYSRFEAADLVYEQAKEDCDLFHVKLSEKKNGSGCTRLDASLLEQNGMMWLGIKLGMKPLKPVQCCERSTHDPDLHLCRDHGKEQVLNRITIYVIESSLIALPSRALLILQDKESKKCSCQSVAASPVFSKGNKWDLEAAVMEVVWRKSLENDP
ncbi:hypothetical protein TURU_122831 [Turdus rufiventris]|nr:hypothetical protein TURU_122831 [Turdus rufiventris]